MHWFKTLLIVMWSVGIVYNLLRAGFSLNTEYPKGEDLKAMGAFAGYLTVATIKVLLILGAVIYL